MSKENTSCPFVKERLGNVGGQAVLEGVMMKSKDKVALSVRDINGKIVSEVKTSKPLASRYKILKFPLIRGIAGFVESMVLSFSTLNRSAEMLGLEEDEEPSKFEKWLEKHFGKSLVAAASVLGAVLGVLLSVGLFIYLPKLFSDFCLDNASNPLLKSALQGVLRIAIFVGYIAAVSLIPDIKRTFMYHGAEHKSIFCHETGLPLTVENVKKQSRFHPRCGTSFLFVMMILGILVSAFYANVSGWLYTVLKICTLPVVVGLGYEFIRYAGRHDNLFVKICSAPGLWMQRLTTSEPDEGMIEVAVNSLKLALPDIYPPESAPVEYESDEIGVESAADSADEIGSEQNAADEETSGEESGGTSDEASETDTDDESAGFNNAGTTASGN